MCWHVEPVLASTTTSRMKYKAEICWKTPLGEVCFSFEDTTMEKRVTNPTHFLPIVAYLSDDRLKL